jgi:hypothetical protein
VALMGLDGIYTPFRLDLIGMMAYRVTRKSFFALGLFLEVVALVVMSILPLRNQSYHTGNLFQSLIPVDNSKNPVLTVTKTGNF